MEQQTKATLESALNALGDSIHEIVETALRVEDVAVISTKPVVFKSFEEKGPYGQGLQWKGAGATKQFVYRANPDRIWTTEIIDLNSEAYYSIDNSPVLRKNELGSSVRKSYLTEVGTLNNLSTQGDLTIDDYIYYNASSQRLGFGTDAPNASISITSLDNEFIIDVEGASTRIGNWTTDDLEIITDDTTRITVSKNGNITLGTSIETKTTVIGKLGINVKNPDADISTSGAVRFQGKKFEVAESIPTNGTYNKGDVVWSNDPKPTGYMGWVCVREGTPGMWKPFGQISS